MANNEVEKIDSLKREREKSYDEVSKAREEEEIQRDMIQKIKLEISNLSKK